MFSRIVVVKQKTLVAIGILALTAMLVGSATATPVGSTMDFSGGSGGVMSFTPALGNTLSIMGAPMGTVQQRPTFFDYTIVGGVLDLVTGGCATGCGHINPAGTSLYLFSDGGSLSISGSIPSLAGDPSGTLIKGSWDSTITHDFGHKVCPITNATMNTLTGGEGMNGCLKISFINPTLLADLNFPSFETGGKGYLSQVFVDVTLSAGVFSGSIKSSDLSIDPLPEPASLALLGSGLLVLGNLGRKKLLHRPTR